MNTPPFPLPPGVHRPTLAIIDLDALAHNLSEIRRVLPRPMGVCAVVKADAYGHGAVAVGRELEALGVESLAVATVEEGIELRRGGVRAPVLVLGIGRSGTEEALEHDLTPVVYSEASARRVMEAAARARGRDVRVQVKLDTGMGRVGLPEDGWVAVAEERLAAPRIRLEGWLTHYSSAESDPDFTRTQARRFRAALERAARLPSCGGEQVHIASSAGILCGEEIAGNLVRPGILLYGAFPDPGLADRADLYPVMTFRTEVMQVKTLPPGSPVSYGQTFRTRRRSRIATLPVGYADGYPRRLSNRGAVLIHGERAPVAGTVTMDLTMVDVTDLPEVREGDEAVLFGRTGTGATLRADEVARAVGSIPYELFCAVSRRVPRVCTRGGRAVDGPRGLGDPDEAGTRTRPGSHG